jgi:hypothetical protein
VHDALARHESFDSLARVYGDENAPKLAEAAPISQLGPEYQQALAKDSTVGLKPVIELAAASGRPSFAVVEVTTRLPEGPLAYDDVRERIRTELSQQLGVQHYLEQVRRQTYVDMRL